MNRSHWVSEKITPTHIAKLAYIYIRQSTMGQVTKHRESTELQYRLSQRAESLGWPADAIKIIDDDLGRSGSSSVERPGFQQLARHHKVAHCAASPAHVLPAINIKIDDQRRPGRIVVKAVVRGRLCDQLVGERGNARIVPQ